VLGSLAGSASTALEQPDAVEPLGMAVEPSVVLALALPALARTMAADSSPIHDSLLRTVRLLTVDPRRAVGAVAAKDATQALGGTQRR